MSLNRILPFLLSNAAAAGWAVFLIQKHNEAITQTLQPGLLCGEEGGCGDVLASQWSELFGIPVSAPAVPMYLTLLALGLAVLAGKMSLQRLSGLAALCGTAGLAFGGWLLFHMLVDVGEICNYCLVMDGLNLLVLITGVLLHPDGVAAAFRAIPDAIGQLFRPAPEVSLIPAIAAGTLILAVAMPAPEGLSEEARAEAAAEAAAAILKEEPATPTPPTPTPAATDAAPVETKRVMLQPARAEVPLGPKTPLKGPKDAPVTIVLFEDFQCPFCRKLAGNLHALMDARPADVRVAWYHFPMLSDCNDHVKKDMHPQACLAAMAGVCAEEQGKFWEMHDTMFSNNARLSARDIRKYAQLEGLALGAFDTCMRAPETLAQVKADASVGAELGVGGTPTFFVNGRRLAGAQPVEVLEAVVDAVQQKDQQERVRLDVALRGEIIGDIGQVPGEVTLDGPYGRFTIDAFEAHVVDGVAKSIPGAEPTRGLSWYDASAACEAAGKRLCSEEEWLSACTGAIPNDLDGDGIYSDDPIQGRRHPYGDYPLENYCASSREKDDARPLIAGNHPKCVTPEGVYDMEGNLKEWIGLAPDRAGLKGGSYFSRNSARCGYFKKDVPPDGADDSMGFRCCRGKDPVDDSAERYPGGKVGDAVQAWSLPTPRGGDFGTADLKGKPFIMTFWASWCGPCRKELPALAALYEKYKDQGLVVVGVNVDRDRNKAKGFLRDMPLPFPVVLDTENELMGRFDAQSVPTTFWVTADGDIRQKTEGYDDRKKDDLETYLTELMRR